jgi:hypothetical protein
LKWAYGRLWLTGIRDCQYYKIDGPEARHFICDEFGMEIALNASVTDYKCKPLHVEILWRLPPPYNIKTASFINKKTK